jgi:GntR family transcriptional regulator, transcriptional repressor for pyruvate dehydrogenase complex
MVKLEGMSALRRSPSRPKLADLIVEDVKRWIVAERKQPGDRLPNEKELVDLFQCSKSTVREALKSLEVHGLIKIRTGPGGGAFLQQVEHAHASEPLRNFLHFHHLDGHHIYQLRNILEPELAASVVGKLTPDQFERLEQTIRLCATVGTTEEEVRAQRVAELEFHSILTESCPNPVLSFICRFMNDLLKDLMIYKKALDSRHFGEANIDYHSRLLDAFRTGDAEKVRAVMAEHMLDAEHHMDEMESHIGALRLLLPGTKEHFSGLSRLEATSTAAALNQQAAE